MESEYIKIVTRFSLELKNKSDLTPYTLARKVWDYQQAKIDNIKNLIKVIEFPRRGGKPVPINVTERIKYILETIDGITNYTLIDCGIYSNSKHREAVIVSDKKPSERAFREMSKLYPCTFTITWRQP